MWTKYCFVLGGNEYLYYISGGGNPPIQLDEEDELVAGIVGLENPAIIGVGGYDTSNSNEQMEECKIEECKT